MSEPTPKLATKLAKAAESVGTVAKNGRNKQQGYDYATASDVATACRNALLAEKVVADFHCVDAEQFDVTSKGGGVGLMVKATCELVVTDADSGESVVRRSIGYGSDFPGDKAIYKAMTGARKYAFIHLLQVPIGDDPEDDGVGQSANAASVKDAAPASGALTFLCGGSPAVAEGVWDAIKQANGGIMPATVADALVLAEKGARAIDDQSPKPEQAAEAAGASA